MLITLIVIVGLSLLIIGHEAGHFFAAKLFKMRVEEFGFGFPPRLAAKKKGETTYSFNALPFGGFVKIAGENDHMDSLSDEYTEAERKHYFFAQATWRRSVVILAGVFINFLIAWVLISGTLAVGTAPTLLVSEVEPASPAAQAGILPGDTIRNFKNTDEFIGYIQAHKGQEVSVAVLRGDKQLDLKLTPRTHTNPNQGAIGVAFSGIEREGLWDSVKNGFLETVYLAKYTLQAFGNLFSNLFAHGSLPQDVVGLVGIFPIAQQVGQAGWIHLVQLIAMISVNLAVVNLLPFPALDGGRFLLILFEKLKGSPLPRKVEGWINTLGFAFLLLLMVLITVRDIIRL